MKLKRISAGLLTAAMILTSCFASGVGVSAEETSIILENPEITLHNLSVQNGTTELLWNNSEKEIKDFDFGPGGDNLQDAYLEYDYGNVVEIDGINFIGWWPKDQAVKEISIYAYEDSQWEPVEEHYVVPWKTNAGSNGAGEFSGGEKLRMDFKEDVTTTKLKIQIHSTYTSWSSKINMRLMAPTGEIISNIKPVYDELKQMKDYVETILVGDKPGEFPQKAVDAFCKTLEEVEEEVENGQLSEEEVAKAVEKLRLAKDELLKSQNPLQEKEGVRFENLTVKSGVETYLSDKQMSTVLELNETGVLEDSAIVFDYGSDSVKLSEIKFICKNPLESGVKNVDISYWDGSAWVTVAENVELGWKGDFDNYEGRTVAFPETIETSKVKIKINETYTKGGSLKINEIIVGKEPAADKESLEELVLRAEQLLAATEEQDTAEVDMVKLKLASAKNEDTLARANQKKIDRLHAELLSAVNKLDESTEDTISPSAPYDAKVEYVGKDCVKFSFVPSEDNIGVAGYKVYHGTAVIKDVTELQTVDGRVVVEINALTENTNYTFVVKAYDAQGNLSEGMSVGFVTEGDEETPVVPQNPEQNTNPNPEQTKPEKPQQPDTDNKNEDKKAPKTGDHANVWMLLILSASAMGILGKRKSEREGNKI